MNLTADRFAVGSLVRARGREWVILPSDDPEVLRLRPLGGTDEDACGLYLPLEGDEVASASLSAPDPRFSGNAVSAALLRDAVRLGLRSAAGPLRSIGRIAVEPLPYQLVPLLMALRLDPVRLLIADDVGVGKTIEAAMVARELLDRGEVRRLCVLSPPHLCPQWRKELVQKFHFPAVEVRPGTVTGLERDLPAGRSLFEEYPYTVVSIDFIKGDRRRASFLHTCPELVIVDEAHAAAQVAAGGAAQQQRHRLLRELAADPQRHILLLTATPHSGDKSAFASLVGLLVPQLEEHVAALELGAGTEARERLARHFVQRRRADLDHYLARTTVFPTRETLELPYQLTPPFKDLLETVRRYTQDLVRAGEGLSRFHQRVRWWAALALLRCVSSSPAAAAAALRSRALQPERPDAEEADRLGQDAVFDILARDEADQDDSTPGADTLEEEATAPAERRRLLELARRAEALRGDHDPKLAAAERLVRDLVDDRFNPIVFCRYVATAHYVAEELSRRLRGVDVACVTGELPPEERAERIDAMPVDHPRVLVATDCLSEGLDQLQRLFNAVVHYDLAWNPARHEQRAGRVDRYRQPSPTVRAALLYGQNNEVDGVVLRVLLRKADQIRKDLGVSVPVPVDTNAVLEAIFEALFLRPNAPAEQLSLFLDQEEERVNRAWQEAADRERRSRTIFAQHSIRPDEVFAELKAAEEAVGSADDVQRFVFEVCTRVGASPFLRNGSAQAQNQLIYLDPQRLPRAVRERAALGTEQLRLGFHLPVPDDVTYVPRTHPLVEALGGFVLDTALDEPERAVASRCGAIRTEAVRERTVLLLLRARFLIEEAHGATVTPMLAEECLLAGFRGDPTAPGWLQGAEVEALARAEPSANLSPGQAEHWLRQVLAAQDAWSAELEAIAHRRSEALLDAHRRVRGAAGLRGVRYLVEPHEQLDLLGVYVLMPHGQ